jgi:hypothetical protein
MESAVTSAGGRALIEVPFDSINAIANTITAAAVLWAARSLRRSLTDIRWLDLQPPFSGQRKLTDEELEAMWREIVRRRREDGDDFS